MSTATLTAVVAADTDANNLVDAAVAYALHGVELDDAQAATVARLFPARNGEAELDHAARIGAVLEAIGDDAREHYHYEQGVELDGEPVREYDAIRALDSARWYAARCIAAGGVA